MTDWVANSIAIGALALSAYSVVRAQTASRRASEATAGHDSIEESLERMANAMQADAQRLHPTPPEHAEANAMQADAQRLHPTPPEHAEASGSAEMSLTATGTAEAGPVPAFNLEYLSDHTYRLRNVGTGTATGVLMTLKDFPAAMTRGMPTDAEMPPFSSVGPIAVHTAAEISLPGEAQISCDQLPEPVLVPIPHPR